MTSLKSIFASASVLSLLVSIPVAAQNVGGTTQDKCVQREGHRGLWHMDDKSKWHRCRDAAGIAQAEPAVGRGNGFLPILGGALLLGGGGAAAALGSGSSSASP